MGKNLDTCLDFVEDVKNIHFKSLGIGAVTFATLYLIGGEGCGFIYGILGGATYFSSFVNMFVDKYFPYSPRLPILPKIDAPKRREGIFCHSPNMTVIDPTHLERSQLKETLCMLQLAD